MRSIVVGAKVLTCLSLKDVYKRQRYNLMERLDGMKKEFQICHGDFNPSNVIVAEDGQLYVCLLYTSRCV